MNISFLTSICIHRSIILIFIGKKSMLIDIFPTENIFSMIFDFHFRENPRFRSETGKYQNNMKKTWNKRTIKQNVDLLVRTGLSRDTWNRKPDPTHWSFGCSHSHTSPTRKFILPNTNQSLLSLSAISRTSICFCSIRMRRFPTQVLSRILQVWYERMRFTTRWWAAFRVKSFKAAVINLQVRGTLLIRV